MRSELTLDELRYESGALRELVDQQATVKAEEPPDRAAIEALTGDDSGPVAYDLTRIWRAALADDGSAESVGKRRYMSPKRYINEWSHMVKASARAEDGSILVDGHAAFDYVQRVDSRVMCATIDHMIAMRKAAAAVDPIGNAVRSAKGGGFAMMFARIDARHLGLSDDEFNAAVLERAKQEARFMDDYAAEEHVSVVRQALEGAPKVKLVSVVGADSDG